MDLRKSFGSRVLVCGLRSVVTRRSPRQSGVGKLGRFFKCSRTNKKNKMVNSIIDLTGSKSRSRSRSKSRSRSRSKSLSPPKVQSRSRSRSTSLSKSRSRSRSKSKSRSPKELVIPIPEELLNDGQSGDCNDEDDPITMKNLKRNFNSRYLLQVPIDAEAKSSRTICFDVRSLCQAVLNKGQNFNPLSNSPFSVKQSKVIINFLGNLLSKLEFKRDDNHLNNKLRDDYILFAEYLGLSDDSVKAYLKGDYSSWMCHIRSHFHDDEGMQGVSIARSLKDLFEKITPLIFERDDVFALKVGMDHGFFSDEDELIFVSNGVQFNQSPLFCSCALGSEKCAKYLISQGADVDKPGFFGLTPLMATYYPSLVLKLKKLESRYHIAFALLEADANINARTSIEWGKKTALFFALDGERQTTDDFILGDLLNLFLRKKYKIDVNLSSNDTGLTPLMLLSAKNYLHTSYEGVKMLLKAGADPDIKDKKGKTALDYAQLRNYNGEYDKQWPFLPPHWPRPKTDEYVKQLINRKKMIKLLAKVTKDGKIRIKSRSRSRSRSPPPLPLIQVQNKLSEAQKLRLSELKFHARNGNFKNSTWGKRALEKFSYEKLFLDKTSDLEDKVQVEMLEFLTKWDQRKLPCPKGEVRDPKTKECRKRLGN